MSIELLERLKSDAFAAEAVFLSTPGALRRFLVGRREVGLAKQALTQGAITEDSLRRFVADLMSDLRRGERFPHEMALAALAVVLEMRPTEFAEEFLHDLSRLRLAEMSLCIRVARECLKHRPQLARTNSKEFDLATGDIDIPFSVAPGPNGSRSSAANRICEVGLCQP